MILAAVNEGTGGSAGPIGLLIVLLLAVATVLLIRNMNKRLRRLPTTFPDRDGGTPEQPEPPAVPPA